MRMHLLITLAAAPGLLAWGDRSLPLPYAGPMPDAPVAALGDVYVPVGKGLKIFKVVEPMPWGDVNKRVTPQGGMEMPMAPGQHDMKQMK